MLRHLFAAPDFLTLLRFWDDCRKRTGQAVWHGDLARVPAELRSNLIVADWSDPPRYRYIGGECIARFGKDPTGQSTLTTLAGAYGAYIRSLGDEVIARRQPIFSTSVFEVGDEFMVSDRLFAPFSESRNAEPGIVLSVHLFSPTAFKLSEVGGSGFVNESRRLLVAGVPALCERLEEARRYHHLARVVASRAQSGAWADIARELSGDALVALQPFRGAAD